MISKVYLFDTGALLVFDENGHQVEEIQAMPFVKALRKTFELATDETQFSLACWNKGQNITSLPTTRERLNLLLERVGGRW